MLFDSKLKKALTAALEDPARIETAVPKASKEQVKSAGEAELIVRLLKFFPRPEPAAQVLFRSDSLSTLVAWMQNVEDEKAMAVFRSLGAVELLRIFDESFRHADHVDDKFHLQDELMFLLKVVCMYAPAGGLERVRHAARSSLLRDAYLWSVIFGLISEEGHPWQLELAEALRDPLPEGFAGVAYLDLTNTLARAGRLERHPFDSEAGLRLLKGWLSARDEDEYSYAHSAAASIPFLGPDARATIQQLADGHPSRDVQLEGAWAAARCGELRGLETLQQACADPRVATSAMKYLEELGAQDRIPVHTRSADFKAMAEMCDWLAHPQEFGRPPLAIEQVDSQELFWPPTNDRRRLWVFRYEYPPDDDEDEAGPDIGFGMVGSVTFALFGEATADMTPAEVYALHCAWELEMNEDDRAPATRTVEAGMRILAEHNPGLVIS